MIPASGLKAGMVLRQKDQLLQVIAAEFHQGGGQMGGSHHVKLRNLATGTVLERRFRPEEKVEVVEVNREKLQFLYQDGDFFVFMNPDSFEQYNVHADLLGPRLPFLKEDLSLEGVFLDGAILSIEFPSSVVLKVVTAPPPRHEQETSTYKSVTLENGMEVLVPQFIKEGDQIRVEVETGKYLERV